MNVLRLCPLCAARYSRVVDPDCRLCTGTGTLAVSIPVGVAAPVAARAVGMCVEDRWHQPGDVRADLRRAGLLTDGPATGLSGVPDGEKDRQRNGVAAGKLLRRLGLRESKPRKPPKRRTKAEIEEQRRQKETAQQSWARMREESARRRREMAAQAKALEALAAAHPDEYEEVYEGELVMVALSDSPLGQVMIPTARRTG